MAYKALVFDFFNVIHRDPFVHWLNKHNLERKGELKKAAESFDLGEIDLEEHHRRVSKASDTPISSVRESFDDMSFIDPEMIGLIRQLKKNYRVGLLSNSAYEYIGQILEQYDLKPLFDTVVISADVHLIKPDPRIFEHILGKIDAKPDEAIFIDDNPMNVEAADRLGIKGIVYKDMDRLRKDLAEAGIKL